jgi:hypothetical protein
MLKEAYAFQMCYVGWRAMEESGSLLFLPPGALGWQGGSTRVKGCLYGPYKLPISSLYARLLFFDRGFPENCETST